MLFAIPCGFLKKQYFVYNIRLICLITLIELLMKKYERLLSIKRIQGHIVYIEYISYWISLMQVNFSKHDEHSKYRVCLAKGHSLRYVVSERSYNRGTCAQIPCGDIWYFFMKFKRCIPPRVQLCSSYLCKYIIGLLL